MSDPTDNQPKDNQPKDRADWIVDKYAAGEMGPNTCARLLMVEMYREMGVSDEELVAIEQMLEMEAGK